MITFNQIITPTDREEVEAAIRAVNLVLLRGRLVCAYLPELIDQRFSNGAA